MKPSFWSYSQALRILRTNEAIVWWVVSCAYWVQSNPAMTALSAFLAVLVTAHTATLWRGPAPHDVVALAADLDDDEDRCTAAWQVFAAIESHEARADASEMIAYLEADS